MEEIEQHFEAQQKLFKQQADEQMKFAAKMRTYKFTAQNEFKNKRSKSETKNASVSKLLELKGEENMKYDGISVKRKTGTKIWWARINRKGKFIVVYGKTQIECYNNLKDTITELYKQGYLNRDNNKKIKYTYTLQEYFNFFMKTYKIDTGEIKPGTIKDNERVFKSFANFYSKKIDLIKESDIVAMINGCHGDRKKQKAYILLRSIFKKAKINDIIKKDPTENVKKPIYEAPEQKAFTVHEQKEFLKCALNFQNKTHGDFLAICLLQGFTRGECWSLSASKLNFQNNTIIINECIKECDSDTGTKNRYRNRIVPMFEETKQILLKYKDVTGRLFDIKLKLLYEDLKSICKLANVPDLTIHELRHTFVTRCQEKQIPLHIIQKWVGHKKGSKVTTSVYTHVSNEVEQNYVDVINNNLL